MNPKYILKIKFADELNIGHEIKEQSKWGLKRFWLKQLERCPVYYTMMEKTVGQGERGHVWKWNEGILVWGKLSLGHLLVPIRGPSYEFENGLHINDI